MAIGQIGAITVNVIQKKIADWVFDQEKENAQILHRATMEKTAVETSEKNLFAGTPNAPVVCNSDIYEKRIFSSKQLIKATMNVNMIFLIKKIFSYIISCKISTVF
jgi:hypothetical protein